MHSAAVDNDVLYKGACYRFLRDLSACFERNAVFAILGVAKYVVGDLIRRRGDICDRAGTSKEFTEFLAYAEELEPTGEEIDLATRIEQAAADRSVALDAGESQLSAIVILRSIPLFITGDKRAIAGAEILLTQVSALSSLARKVLCFEQLVVILSGEVGLDELRTRIQSEPHTDTVMSICFRSESHAVVMEGLDSYIEDVRRKSPTVLHPLSVDTSN